MSRGVSRPGGSKHERVRVDVCVCVSIYQSLTRTVSVTCVAFRHPTFGTCGQAAVRVDRRNAR